MFETKKRIPNREESQGESGTRWSVWLVMLNSHSDKKMVRQTSLTSTSHNRDMPLIYPSKDLVLSCQSTTHVHFDRSLTARVLAHIGANAVGAMPTLTVLPSTEHMTHAVGNRCVITQWNMTHTHRMLIHRGASCSRRGSRMHQVCSSLTPALLPRHRDTHSIIWVQSIIYNTSLKGLLWLSHVIYFSPHYSVCTNSNKWLCVCVCFMTVSDL